MLKYNVKKKKKKKTSTGGSLVAGPGVRITHAYLRRGEGLHDGGEGVEVAHAGAQLPCRLYPLAQHPGPLRHRAARHQRRHHEQTLTLAPVDTRHGVIKGRVVWSWCFFIYFLTRVYLHTSIHSTCARSHPHTHSYTHI